MATPLLKGGLMNVHLQDQVVSFDKDFESFVDGLTLPMNEEQLYRH
jgi:hypothetical protein